MSLESQAFEFINQMMSVEDSVIEQDYDKIIDFFKSEETFEQSLVDKIAHCRANNLTEDDLIQENKTIEESIKNDLNELSPIKKKLLSEIFLISNGINERILEKGLFPKVNVRVQKMNSNIELPQYAHENGDSGLDIKILTDTVIPAKTTMIIPTGLKVAIPLGYEIQIRPRSGNSLNYNDLFVANSPGTIDANYREELGIILRNIGTEPILLTKGVKIAQAVLCPVIKLQWVEVDNINDFPTERRGGFGSTGA